MNERELDLSIYLVTDAGACAQAGRGVIETVLAAVEGGVTCVQVREKQSVAEQLELVQRLGEALPEHVALIVNDRVDVFLAVRRADARVTGVHVGQGDLPVAAVRGLVGDAVIGLSARTPEQLRAAEAAGVDYVGIGPLHDTATKLDAPAGLGHDRWAELSASTVLPAVAIGGVTRADISALRAAGAAGVAVVSAVCADPAPQRAARVLADAWCESRVVGTGRGRTNG